MSVTLMFFAGCKKDTAFLGRLGSYNWQADSCALTAESVQNLPLHSEYFAIKDSLLFSYAPYGEEFSIDIVNIINGKKEGRFFPCGRGHNEYLTVSPIIQFFNVDSLLKSLVYAPNEMKMMVWNISESLMQQETIIESVRTSKWNDGYGVPYSRCVSIGLDSILVYRPSVHISNNNEITPPLWQIRNYSTNELIKDIAIYRPTDNPNSKVLPENFYSTSSCVSPDMNRLAEAMYWLPQINIVNFKKNKICGYLLKSSDDYSVFKSDMTYAITYYNGIQVNDNYIFALWLGKLFSEEDYIGMDEIHVFNWDGEMIKRIKLSNHIHSMYLDIDSNSLYGYNTDEECIYKFGLKDIGL